MQDVERMLICSLCGAPSCFGFGVTLDGIRMGDVGDWRCSMHHPEIKAGTREQWAEARSRGRMTPEQVETMREQQ